jgi:WD40 repeat protein
MKPHLTYQVVSSLSLPPNEKVGTVSIDPDGYLIAAGGTDGRVFVWCLHTHKLLCHASPSPGEQDTADVTSMIWLRGGMLFFGRKNGLLGMLRVRKAMFIIYSHAPVSDTPAEIHRGSFSRCPQVFTSFRNRVQRGYPNLGDGNK